MEYQSIFFEFLSNGNCKCGGLLAALLSDFSNNVAKMEMQVLGVIGKPFSGPYVLYFCRQANESYRWCCCD